MTRISRISTPRATLAAVALIVIVMAGFGVFADDGEARNGHVANQRGEPAAQETTHHCWTRTPAPLVAIDRRLKANNDDQL